MMEEEEVSTREHAVKKARVEQDDISKSTHSQVTPMSSTRNEATDVRENVHNVSMEQDDLDATSSPMKKKSLDPVFENAESLVPCTLSTEKDDEVTKPQNSSTNLPKTKKKKMTFKNQVLLHMMTSMKPSTIEEIADEMQTTDVAISHIMLHLLDKKIVYRKECGENWKEQLYWLDLEKAKKEIYGTDVPSASDMESTRNDLGENVNNASMEEDDLDAASSPMKQKSLDPVFENAERPVSSTLSTEKDDEAAKPQNSSTNAAEVEDEAENNNSSMMEISKGASNVEVLKDNPDLDFGNNDIHDDDSSEGSVVDCLDLEDEEDSSPVAKSSKKPEPTKPDEISTVENSSTSNSRKKSSQEEVTTPTDECRETVEKSREVLDFMKKILEDNELFCSNDRRQEWLKEISSQLNDSEPKTTIGVLGNTGVGKSSLLNALLDEASVLPTSGSRGCTAAVVELRFNADMEKADPTEKQVACYRGDVEFMTLQEWQTELKILVDECSTHEKTVYAREPDPQTAAEAAASWAKIDQVYGKGTMSRFVRQPSTTAFNRLANDFRVKRLLTAQPNSGKLYNVISVSEGLVVPGSNEAKGFLANHQDMNRKARRTRNKWAKDFRAKINSYVYRKGNGEQAQTWPLIRKVVLHGPWACLSTGACLVDLPVSVLSDLMRFCKILQFSSQLCSFDKGVRDANAARAKVAEQYLQNCSQIWVVAPIKRAVDDGTAKELLGEQFKRRLLMDGSYGNVSFICTQTVSILFLSRPFLNYHVVNVC